MMIWEEKQWIIHLEITWCKILTVKTKKRDKIMTNRKITMMNIFPKMVDIQIEAMIDFSLHFILILSD